MTCLLVVATSACSQLTEASAGVQGAGGAPVAAQAQQPPATGRPIVVTPVDTEHATQAVVLGDSLSVQATDALHQQLPGIIVDAVVGRTMVTPSLTDEALTKIPALVALDPAWFVVELGTNDSTFSGYGEDKLRADITTILDAIGRDRCVAWVLPYAEAPRSPMEIANTELFRTLLPEVLASTPCNRLLDWAEIAAKEPPVLASDGVHLSDVGMQRFADLISFGVS